MYGHILPVSCSWQILRRVLQLPDPESELQRSVDALFICAPTWLEAFREGTNPKLGIQNMPVSSLLSQFLWG